MDSSGGVSVTDPVDRRVSSEGGGTVIFVRWALFFLSLFVDLADDVDDDDDAVVAVLHTVALTIVSDSAFRTTEVSLGEMGAAFAINAGVVFMTVDGTDFFAVIQEEKTDDVSVTVVADVAVDVVVSEAGSADVV